VFPNFAIVITEIRYLSPKFQLSCLLGIFTFLCKILTVIVTVAGNESLFLYLKHYIIVMLQVTGHSHIVDEYMWLSKISNML
jgi:hypothetical protein